MGVSFIFDDSFYKNPDKALNKLIFDIIEIRIFEKETKQNLKKSKNKTCRTVKRKKKGKKTK